MADAGENLPIFVYGTLRDTDVLALALGPLMERVKPVQGVLPGFETRSVDGGAYPALRPAPGAEAPGLLLTPADRDVRRALDFFEDAFDYTLSAQSVIAGGQECLALVYLPGASVLDDGTPWSLEQWARGRKSLFLEAGREIMTHRLRGAARAGVLRRAAQRIAAAGPSPAGRLRTAFEREAVTEHRVERLYTGFFAFEAHYLRHRTFAGGSTDEIRREVLVNGDAVSVLPWDPVTDRVLLIEQFRAGILARGEANPWNVEVIAGLVDGAESAEETARREAEEEAGITLRRLYRAAGFYPTPGAVTEFVTSFIGEADLADVETGIHGLEHEHEDIRTIVVPREEAMAAIRTGEARNAPLLISLMALEAERGRLLAEWVGGVAVPRPAG